MKMCLIALISLLQLTAHDNHGCCARQFAILPSKRNVELYFIKVFKIHSHFLYECILASVCREAFCRMSAMSSQSKPKWKRKYSELEQPGVHMSSLGKCLLEQFAAGTSVISLMS